MDDIDIGQPVGRDPRVTRRKVRAMRRKRAAKPPCEPRYVSPEPAVAFAVAGILVGLWAIAFMVARAREVMVAGGW